MNIYSRQTFILSNVERKTTYSLHYTSHQRYKVSQNPCLINYLNSYVRTGQGIWHTCFSIFYCLVANRLQFNFIRGDVKKSLWPTHIFRKNYNFLQLSCQADFLYKTLFFVSTAGNFSLVNLSWKFKEVSNNQHRLALGTA